MREDRRNAASPIAPYRHDAPRGAIPVPCELCGRIAFQKGRSIPNTENPGTTRCGPRYCAGWALRVPPRCSAHSAEPRLTPQAGAQTYMTAHRTSPRSAAPNTSTLLPNTCPTKTGLVRAALDRPKKTRVGVQTSHFISGSPPQPWLSSGNTPSIAKTDRGLRRQVQHAQRAGSGHTAKNRGISLRAECQPSAEGRINSCLNKALSCHDTRGTAIALNPCGGFCCRPQAL